MVQESKQKVRAPWSRDQVLLAWGLRIGGASLSDPVRIYNPQTRSGMAASTDDEMQAVAYVKSVDGYGRAFPVLSHVYRDGYPVEMFGVTGPGETLTRALMRLGWTDLYGLVRRHDMAARVLEQFHACIDAKLAEKPFIPVPPLADYDDDFIPTGWVWDGRVKRWREKIEKIS